MNIFNGDEDLQRRYADALKTSIDKTFGVDMNKPVAWAYMKDGVFWDAIHPDEHDREEGSYTVPLYTHPVKKLTDEEIKEFVYAFQLWQLHNPDKGLEGIMAFARAILRKARND